MGAFSCELYALSLEGVQKGVAGTEQHENVILWYGSLVITFPKMKVFLMAAVYL